MAGVLLGTVATVVIWASAVTTLTALERDLRIAYTWAGPSIFTETDQRQMAAVRAAVPEGATVLIVAGKNDIWHMRLWQRGLYPRNPAAVMLAPYSPDTLKQTRDRFGIRWVVLIGPPPVSPQLVGSRELGVLQGLPSRVRFGELAP